MSDSFLRRHRLAAFYLISLVIVSLVVLTSVLFGASQVLAQLCGFLQSEHLYPNVLSISSFALPQPWRWLILTFPAAPTLSAVAVNLVTGGTQGIRGLF